MQADRLTPAQLRDLEEIYERFYQSKPLKSICLILSEEAARREAGGKHNCSGSANGKCVGSAANCKPGECHWLEGRELGRASVAADVAPPVAATFAPQGEREGPDSAAAPVRGTAAPDLVAHAAESNAPLWIAPNGTGFVHVGFTLADVRRLAEAFVSWAGEEHLTDETAWHPVIRPFLPLLKETT